LIIYVIYFCEKKNYFLKGNDGVKRYLKFTKTPTVVFFILFFNFMDDSKRRFVNLYKYERL